MITNLCDKDLNIKFVRETISRTIQNNETGEKKTTDREVIKIMNTENGKSRIHPYTDFLNKWRNSSIKRAYDVACHIVPFLNYIHFTLSDDELPSVQELTFYHGANYLQEYSDSGVKRSTVLQRDNVIKDFYYYLTEKGLLCLVKKSDFTFIDSRHGKITVESPFRDKYTLPAYEKTDRLHQIDYELIFEFVRTAVEVTPRISLGVYFQIFGGLRVSEVLNIAYTQIHMKSPNGRNGMVLELKKNRFRPDLKKDAFTSPKKVRNQPVLPIGNLLSKLYLRHTNNYQKPGCNAVFINNDGLPMSRDSYYYYFEKLKNAFIKRLRTNKNPIYKLYADFLNSQDWSTHICRGIFSELIADSANTPLEIAIWRGDSDIRLFFASKKCIKMLHICA